MNTLVGLLLFMFLNGVLSQVGLDCTSRSGQVGQCKLIKNCPAAIEDIKRKVNPTICSFQGIDPIVCCAGTSAPPTTSPPPVATTPKKAQTTVKPYVPPVYDYQSNNGRDMCEPISANETAPRTGRKAWDKCIEYQETLIYPCVKGVVLTGEMSRARHCGHAVKSLIIGGKDASVKEFPHMALLGFGDTAQNAQFLCGGSLISDQYILTAGHCTSSREYGVITFAVLGVQKRSDPILKDNLYKIDSIIKHPNYKPPSKYNDIALLRTDRKVALSATVVPACIHFGDPVIKDEVKAEATGWGAIEYRGTNADTLQKVTLEKFSDAECLSQFPVGMRNMVNGFDARTQICFGDKKESKDACQGDSGGPIQIQNTRIFCMYTVIGVTSFGKACGFVGEAGIYTRVAAFAPWIESIVWP